MKRYILLLAILLLPANAWAPPGGGGSGPPVRAFKNIAAGGNTVQADRTDDTLTLTAGSNVNIASSPTADSVTISATLGTGAGTGDFLADGTVPMTGDFNADGNDIINVSDIELESAAPTITFNDTTAGHENYKIIVDGEIMYIYNMSDEGGTIKESYRFESDGDFSLPQGDLRVAQGALGSGRVLYYEDTDFGGNYIIVQSPTTDIDANYTLTLPKANATLFPNPANAALNMNDNNITNTGNITPNDADTDSIGASGNEYNKLWVNTIDDNDGTVVVDANLDIAGNATIFATIPRLIWTDTTAGDEDYRVYVESDTLYFKNMDVGGGTATSLLTLTKTGGTIYVDLVNTANPWAENEIVSTVITETDMAAYCTTDGYHLQWNTGGTITCDDDDTGAGGSGAAVAYKFIVTDSGTATADSSTDTVNLLGGQGIDTSSVADTVTITLNAASTDLTDTANILYDDGTDNIDDTHVNWGTGAGQVSAVDVPIADAGGIITGTEVETALQENRTAINLNTTHRSSNGSDHSYINQNVTTTGNPQFTTVEVGAATDTTLARPSAGNLSVEGNLIYRAGGTDVPVGDGGTGASTAAAARANLEAPSPTNSVVISGAALTTDYYPLIKRQTAITITDIHCITDTGTVVIELYEGTSTSFETGGEGVDGGTTITCDSNGAEDDGTLSNGTIDANDWLAARIGTEASTPTMVNITWYYTVD